MAWLQVHQTLKDHRKLFNAADELEIEPVHMMGLLVSFWMWALDNTPSGNLANITPRMIARAAQWDGDPESLTKAWLQAGWLDKNEEDSSLFIHDWYEYTGKLIEQREAEKKRSQRRRSAGKTEEYTQQTDGQIKANQKTSEINPQNDQQKTVGRVEKTRVENIITTPPSPSNEGETQSASVIEQRFLEFWRAYPNKKSKEYAYKAWKRLKPNAELHQKIMQAIEIQKRSEDWIRENGRFIPHPASWLNGGQWENEVKEAIRYASNTANPSKSDESDAGKNWTKGFKTADIGLEAG